MLVELFCSGINLVNNIYLPTRRIVGKEHINVVSVDSFCSPNITIGIVHFCFPRLAVGISASTYAALGILDSDIISVNLDMSFLIVAGLFLCLAGVGVYLAFLGCDLLR